MLRSCRWLCAINLATTLHHETLLDECWLCSLVGGSSGRICQRHKEAQLIKTPAKLLSFTSCSIQPTMMGNVSQYFYCSSFQSPAGPCLTETYSFDFILFIYNWPTYVSVALRLVAFCCKVSLRVSVRSPVQSPRSWSRSRLTSTDGTRKKEAAKTDVLMN